MIATCSMVDLTQQELELRQADEKLAVRLRRGDADALAELYDRHGAPAFRMAHRITANRALAEEVVQEAFLAVWRSDRYLGEMGSLRAWLFALVHHKAVDAVRRESSIATRQTAHAAREPRVNTATMNPEAAILDDIRDEAVRAALSELPREQREALVLAYFGGHTQREIAESTGIPLGTVKTRMFAGMRRMKDRLAAVAEPAKEGPDE